MAFYLAGCSVHHVYVCLERTVHGTRVNVRVIGFVLKFVFLLGLRGTGMLRFGLCVCVMLSWCACNCICGFVVCCGVGVCSVFWRPVVYASQVILNILGSIGSSSCCFLFVCVSRDGCFLLIIGTRSICFEL